ncbi:oxidase [Luteibacter jiangsuensis]|uniref:Oxidase n=1 Tax=Luteibacter jiangsuensis TaxID=637577 RepID=A0ABX0Q7E4_9GAMM|nr:cytochrome C oxidase subunit IV family protein [Luteibacter jiangsuensis]NID06474.1 oxidase [Luteibacter jiangsuensis]
MSERPPSLIAHVAALAALAVLLLLSIVVSRIHLGTWNTVAGPGIAAAKAAIVVFFFMKLRRSKPAIHFAACFGVAWLTIMIVLTLGDFLTRLPVLVK